MATGFRGEDSLGAPQGGGIMSKSLPSPSFRGEEELGAPIPRYKPYVPKKVVKEVHEEYKPRFMDYGKIEIPSYDTDKVPEKPKGHTKNNIKNIQQFLKDKGFKDKKGTSLIVDGKWGANSKYALEAYKAQTDKILSQDRWVSQVVANKRTVVVGDRYGRRSRGKNKIEGKVTGIDDVTVAMMNSSKAADYQKYEANKSEDGTWGFTKKEGNKNYKNIISANKYQFGIVDELIKDSKGRGRKIRPLQENQSLISWFAENLGLDEDKDVNIIKNAINRDPRGDSNAWCAAFIYFAIKNTNANDPEYKDALVRKGDEIGYELNRAHRYQDVGTSIYEYDPIVDQHTKGSLEAVRPGDMIVFNRGRQRNIDGSFVDVEGHVGVVVQRYSDSSVLVLGANQGNKVSLRMFSPEIIKKFFPSGYKINRLENMATINPALIAELTSDILIELGSST